MPEVERVLEKKFDHETAWHWVEELLGKMLQTAYNDEVRKYFIFC